MGLSGRRVRHPQFLGHGNMVWRSPPRSLDDGSGRKKENHEELDHEKFHFPCQKIQIDQMVGFMDTNGGKTWMKILQWHFQISLNISSYPHYAPNPTRGYRSCTGCNSEVGYGNYLARVGTYFHPECFQCRSCRNQITECEVSSNKAGLIEYRCHPFGPKSIVPHTSMITQWELLLRVHGICYYGYW